MLYSYIKSPIEKAYREGAKLSFQYGIKPIHLHIAFGILMLFTFISIATGGYTGALLFMLISRYVHGVTDTLLSAYQNKNKPISKFDLFLMECGDYLFYGGFVFFFMIGQMSSVIPGAFLILAIYLNAATELSFKTVAEIQDTPEDMPFVDVIKPIYGLAQGTEAIIAFTLMCLIPAAFPLFAVLYGFVCFASAVGRVLETKFIFGSTVADHEDIDLADAFEDGGDDEESETAIEKPAPAAKKTKKTTPKTAETKPDSPESK